MAHLEILTLPDPRLHVKADPVEKVDSSVRKLMDDLLETMYAEGGMGLASVQVGITKRVVVIDLGECQDVPFKPLLMANPKIKWASAQTQMTTEACLSVPGQSGDVIRPLEVEISYLDQDNKLQNLKASHLLADCIQHEIDHLDGILYIEHLSALKRRLIMSKFFKKKSNKR